MIKSQYLKNTENSKRVNEYAEECVSPGDKNAGVDRLNPHHADEIFAMGSAHVS